MEKRRGASISVKMIATSTLLILIIVALFGILNVVNTSRVFDESGGSASATRSVASLQKRGVGRRPRTSCKPSRTPSCSTDYTTLQNFVPDIAKDDPEVAYVYVADKEGIGRSRTPTRSCNGKPMTDPSAKELLAGQGRGHARRSTGADRQRSIVFSRPVVQDGARQGTVVLAYSLQVLDDDAEEARSRQGGARSRRPGCAPRWSASSSCWSAPRSPSSRACDLAADQAARVARRPDRARRSRGPRRDLVGRRDRHARRELQLHGRPTAHPAAQTAEKATLEQELEVARTIQETLVPPPRSGRAAVRQVRRLLPAGVAERRRLVDGARHARRRASWSSSATSPATACRRR